MKSNHSVLTAGSTHADAMKQRLSFAWLSILLLLSLVLALPSRAQIQYVPVVSTYAGGATATTLCANATDSIGDGCVATSAILNGPISGDADAAGNIYFPDSAHDVIRRIDATTGVITLVAGQIGVSTSSTQTPQCTGDVDGFGDGCLAKQAILNGPRCVRIDHAGNIAIADSGNNVIRNINKNTGIITVLMGEIGKSSATPPKNTAPVSPSATLLDNPYFMEFDPAGNMIATNASGNFLPIAMAINGVVDPVNSLVYNLAGTGAKGTTGNDGPASAAKFDGTRGLGIDAAENVYVADYQAFEIRRISSPGAEGQVTLAGITAATVTDYAGNGTSATTGDGGLATAAELSAPQAVDFDNAGNVLLQQSSTNVIRSINPTTNIINNYAGTGKGSNTGDGGPATQATFNVPIGVKVNLGNRFTVFDDSNSRIRNIYPTPFFSASAVGSPAAAQNVAIQASAAVTPSAASISNSEFSVGTASGCTLGKAMASAAYCTFPLKFMPAGPGLRQGQLKITDSTGNVYNDTLLGVGLAPAAAFYGAPITTVLGNGTAGSSSNLVNAPRGGAFDSYGNFYFADSGNNVIREIVKKDGSITIVAGNGTGSFGGDGAAATLAQLNAPTGIAIDPAGNIYIADARNNRIREVNANTGIITTIAGTGTAGYTGDTGLATAATLNNPTGIAIDNAGVLYVADTGNSALRAFSPLNGLIVTLAGNGTAGYRGDGGIPQMAELNAPTAVTIDLSGNIYVADTGNAVIRRIVPVSSGIINFQANISTYAGSAGGDANSGDGGAAISASLLTPGGIGVDAAGDLYIAAGNQVRMVSASSGIITTIAGTGATGPYSGEGGSALGAVLPVPASDLAVDQVGNIYLSDTAANRIVEIAGSSAAPIQFGSQIVASTSTPQTVTLYNSGNQNLNITNIAIPTGFALSNTASNSCNSTTVLTPGEACTLTVTFTPTSLASYSSQITITDNALNSATGMQTIPLIGTGVAHLNATTTTVTYSPTTPTYGQTVTITATVTGGTNTSGNINFVINSTTTVSAPIVNGQATYQVSRLLGGMNSITANYLGDTANASSAGNVMFTVQPAVVTATADNFSEYPTQAIPTLTYTFSGFVNGDIAATAISGTPALSTTATTASPAGTYPITISQGTLAATNYTFDFVPGTYTVVPGNFTISVSPTSFVIPSGQNGVINVTITPSIGYTGVVNLSCGPLPAIVRCTFNTPSIAIDGGPSTMQLTISTNNFPEVASLPSNHLKLLSFAFGLPLLSLAVFSKGSARRRRLLRGMLALVLLASIQSLGGCGESTRDAAPFAGIITITGTDSAKVTSQATFGLTIK